MFLQISNTGLPTVMLNEYMQSFRSYLKPVILQWAEKQDKKINTAITKLLELPGSKKYSVRRLRRLPNEASTTISGLPDGAEWPSFDYHSLVSVITTTNAQI